MLDALAASSGADWQLASLTVYAFNRGGVLRCGTVFDRSVNSWIRGKARQSFPLNGGALKTYSDVDAKTIDVIKKKADAVSPEALLRDVRAYWEEATRISNERFAAYVATLTKQKRSRSRPDTWSEADARKMVEPIVTGLAGQGPRIDAAEKSFGRGNSEAGCDSAFEAVYGSATAKFVAMRPAVSRSAC